MYLDRFRLEGRVAVVTGGAQAIGLACVEALAEVGGMFISRTEIRRRRLRARRR